MKRSKKAAPARGASGKKQETTTPEFQESRFWKQAAWIALFIVLAALHLTTVSGEIGGTLGGDSVVYLLLGRALAAGQGYVDLYLSGHPAHTQYPFMFPLIISFFFKLFDNPITALHVMIPLINVASIMFLALWCALRLESAWKGLAFGLVFGSIPALYLQSGHILSEPLYLFFTYAALCLMAVRKEGRGFFAVLTLAALAAFFTRSAGLTIVLTVAFFLWRRGVVLGVAKKNIPAVAVFGIIFIAAAAAWSTRNAMAGGQASTYFSQFLQKDPYDIDQGMIGAADLAARLAGNAYYYATTLGVQIFTTTQTQPFTSTALSVAGIFFTVVACVGCGREFVGRRGEAEIFTLLSVGMILVWPYREPRFLMPILPLACFYFYSGLEWGIPALSRNRAAVQARAMIIAILVVVHVIFLPGFVADRFYNGESPRVPIYVTGYKTWSEPVINWADYDFFFRRFSPETRDQLNVLTCYLVINRVAARITPERSVLLSRKPMITYFYSGRESVPILRDEDVDLQWRYLVDKGVDYIVLGLEEEQVMPLLLAHPERFEDIATIPETGAGLVRVKKESDLPGSFAP